ncbi:MAG TPA: hypothetical protein PLB38_01735 [bacterium]|nr:hypothetical protein [bacterium]
MEKILNFLRKIGLLRSSGGSWKGDAKNRPVSASTDEIYNDEDKLSKTEKTSKNNGYKTSLSLKILFNINIILFVIVLISFIGNDTYNFWFLLNLTAWGYFFYLLVKALQNRGPNMKNLIIGTIILSIFSFLSFFSIPTTTAGLDYETKMDPLALVDLSLELEENLLLENVRISESAGDILDIRVKTPDNVSQEAIIGATAYIFSYLEPSIDESLKTFRLIMTVNEFDATIIECQRVQLENWMAQKQSDEAFFATLQIKNLLK